MTSGGYTMEEAWNLQVQGAAQRLTTTQADLLLNLAFPVAYGFLLFLEGG